MILGVNIDHIATVRQARRSVEPDPVTAAALALLGGADGVTAHLREDRRHINDRDVRLLREVVSCEFNLEMAATDEMIDIALMTKPDMATLVPEKRQELTTEGGLDVVKSRRQLKHAVSKLHAGGIAVSLFIDPEQKAIDIAKEIGADMVEIHTGRYADTRGAVQQNELHRIIDSVLYAERIGLTVNAGHGLNYHNVRAVAAIAVVRGLYIGHSIVSRAVLVGMERAVREMKMLIEQH
ncbi:MAG TPA: pyridoxine 5'-phosphate synthase [Dissulfurispiraceae bacterium]|nr:pyridoxine 5'-phosphate synthase [Dissulfurispiraceae bacterium]